MNEDRFLTTRRISFFITSIVCGGYSISTIVFNQPDPIEWYWPSIAGILTFVIIFISVLKLEGPQKIALHDEGYDIQNMQSAQFGYWSCVALFALAGGLAFLGGYGFDVLFAFVGTGTAAAYLGHFAFNDWRSSLG